jgi:hypothetical protein
MRQQLDWNNIKVLQFQQFLKVATNTDLPQQERSTAIISILFEIPIEELKTLPGSKYDEIHEQCLKFLDTPMPGEKEDIITVGNNRYRVKYDCENFTLPLRQRIAEYSSSIDTLHQLMAMMLEPINKDDQPITFVDDTDHQFDLVAKDLQRNCSIVQIHHSCEYFKQQLK